MGGNPSLPVEADTGQTDSVASTQVSECQTYLTISPTSSPICSISPSVNPENSESADTDQTLDINRMACPAPLSATAKGDQQQAVDIPYAEKTNIEDVQSECDGTLPAIYEFQPGNIMQNERIGVMDNLNGQGFESRSRMDEFWSLSIPNLDTTPSTSSRYSKVDSPSPSLQDQKQLLSPCHIVETNLIPEDSAEMEDEVKEEESNRRESNESSSLASPKTLTAQTVSSEREDISQLADLLSFDAAESTTSEGAEVTLQESINMNKNRSKDPCGNANSQAEHHIVQENLCPPNDRQDSERRTRSGGRFSDDTNMLKDFLNRAQAKKAARSAETLAPDLPHHERASGRSPRKVLGQLEHNSPSPAKAHTLLHRPSLSPGKQATKLDKADPIAEQIPLCRRSTRTRLPAPPKVVPGAPSFIPVRRPDGTDPVVVPPRLTTSELANVTRANTKRNKGQSKFPRAMLKNLAREASAEMAVASTQRATRSGKSVDWNDEMTCYTNGVVQTVAMVENMEKVTIVQRLKEVAVARRTPTAAKKGGEEGIFLNGTRAPRRQRKARV